MHTALKLFKGNTIMYYLTFLVIILNFIYLNAMEENNTSKRLCNQVNIITPKSLQSLAGQLIRKHIKAASCLLEIGICKTDKPASFFSQCSSFKFLYGSTGKKMIHWTLKNPALTKELIGTLSEELIDITKNNSVSLETIEKEFKSFPRDLQQFLQKSLVQHFYKSEKNSWFEISQQVTNITRNLSSITASPNSNFLILFNNTPLALSSPSTTHKKILCHLNEQWKLMTSDLSNILISPNGNYAVAKKPTTNENISLSIFHYSITNLKEIYAQTPYNSVPSFGNALTQISSFALKDRSSTYAFSPDSKKLAYHDNGNFYLFDIEVQEHKIIIPKENSITIPSVNNMNSIDAYSLSFLSNNKLAIGTCKGMIYIYNIKTSTISYIQAYPKKKHACNLLLASSPQATHIAVVEKILETITSTDTQNVKIFSVKNNTLKELYEIQIKKMDGFKNKNYINNIFFTDNYSIVIVTSKDLLAYSLQTGELIATFSFTDLYPYLCPRATSCSIIAADFSKATGFLHVLFLNSENKIHLNTFKLYPPHNLTTTIQQLREKKSIPEQFGPLKTIKYETTVLPYNYSL